ncbi:MAG: STAS domain-containing protein [Planctomycetes bacterium]|nr:STAS domain-containing protein [Planctomycetota bacterium]
MTTPQLGIPANSPGIDLGEAADVARCAELYRQLRQLLDSDANSVAIEAGRCRKVDAAGLQLLCSFRRKALGLGRSVVWISPPHESLLEAAALLDLDEALGLKRKAVHDGDDPRGR